MSNQAKSDMRIRIGVLAAIFVGYSSSGLATGYAELQASFPDISIETIMMLTSVMGISNMISSLSVGVLQRWLSQKMVLCIGLAITLTGIIPVFVSNNFWLLMAIVALIGFGTGMLTGCGPAYISNHFTGEARVQMLGLKMSVQGVGSVLFSLVGGALAVMGWQYSYLPFILVGIALVMCVVMLPREKSVHAQAMEAEKEQDEGDADESAADLARRERDGLGIASPMPICLIAITCAICMTGSAQAGVALHLASWNMGNSATAGVVVALMSVGMVFGGAIAPKVIGLFKTHTQAVCLFLAAAGLIIAGLSRNIILFSGVMLVWGAVYAIYFGHNLNYLSGILKPSSVPLAMSLNAGLSSGCFSLGVPIINAFAGFYPWEASTSGFITMGIILAVVCALVVITGFEKKLANHML